MSSVVVAIACKPSIKGKVVRAEGETAIANLDRPVNGLSGSASNEGLVDALEERLQQA
jgi:hypothetical protein